MLKICLLMTVLVVTVLALPQVYAFVDGNELYKALIEAKKSDKDKPEWILVGQALGYVAGVIDSLTMLDAQPRCPNNINLDQMRELVFQYLQSHPEQRHFSAAYLSYKAVTDKILCLKRE